MSRAVPSLVPPTVAAHLSREEEEWLAGVAERFGGRYPNLREMWMLMDEVWQEKGCDPAEMNERIGAFYGHPVWLLTGLFIEQDTESRKNSARFAEWVARQKPMRVADYGGGYGTLARMIGAACPHAQVEVIEPHPHAAAIARVEETANIHYVGELSGEYDVLIATDVFEHVPDPIALMQETAEFLSSDGLYLTANCYRPVIRCHLPQSLHFFYSWSRVVRALGLRQVETVAYGQVFARAGKANEAKARRIEQISRRWSPAFDRLPMRGRARVGKFIFSLIP